MWFPESFGLAGIFFMLMMVVFWGGIIALIVWGITRLTRREPTLRGRQTPIEIARERYARGEITREQFEQLKRDLE